jgi:hypothetical protein
MKLKVIAATLGICAVITVLPENSIAYYGGLVGYHGGYHRTWSSGTYYGGTRYLGARRYGCYGGYYPYYKRCGYTVPTDQSYQLYPYPYIPYPAQTYPYQSFETDHPNRY